MSNRPHVTYDHAVQSALTQYILDTFVDELSSQADITVTADLKGLPPISLRPDEGWLIHLLLKMIHAQTVVEIGTLAGYSASWIARALPDDGKLYSLDVNPQHAEIAQAVLTQANLAHKVEIIVGDAHQTLGIMHGMFDAVFLDADKTGYPAYLKWALAHVRSGGLILAHNAFQAGRIVKNPADLETMRDATAAMQEFNRLVAVDDRLLATIIPGGDGLLVAMVK